MDLFLLGQELVVALATWRIACVVGVESHSGPQGTLPCLGWLVTLMVQDLEPLGSLCLTLTVGLRAKLFTHISTVDSQNNLLGGYCPCFADGEIR